LQSYSHALVCVWGGSSSASLTIPTGSLRARAGTKWPLPGPLPCHRAAQVRQVALMHDADLHYDNTKEDQIGNTPSTLISGPSPPRSPAWRTFLLHGKFGYHVKCRGRGNEWRRVGGADPFLTRHAADISSAASPPSRHTGAFQNQPFHCASISYCRT
jgi:hypothetical protein